MDQCFFYVRFEASDSLQQKAIAGAANLSFEKFPSIWEMQEAIIKAIKFSNRTQVSITFMFKMTQAEYTAWTTPPATQPSIIKTN